MRTTLDISADVARAFVTSPELIIAYSVAVAEVYMADQTLPDAYWQAAERGDDPLPTMDSHIFG